MILIGAHYDSTGDKKGSGGPPTTVPASPPCWRWPKHSRGRPCPYTVRFAFFGAEENGLNGSKAYAASLDSAAVAKLLAMVNYDTIAGATSSTSTGPLRRGRVQLRRSEPLQLRSQGTGSPAGHLQADRHPVCHPPQLQRLPGRGDRQLVRSCAVRLPRVPIAYVEATNFTINGADGYDGYSQTTNPALWDCYDDATKSACDRDSETQWGKIWHTQYDRLDKMAELFPGRVQQQLGANTELMIRFLKEPGL